jgi:prepilin-type N-terminal cleavage/methylation domain-containing protein
MFQRRPGFTLVEVSLSIAVGLVVMAAAIAAFSGVQRATKFSNAKSMVGTIQTNIGAAKFRSPTGSPPPFSAVAGNLDPNTGKPFWPDSPGKLPGDPVYGINGVMIYSSTATPAPIAAGDPTPAWDHPSFQGSPTPTPPPGFTAPAGYTLPAGYGKGGWLYDPTTGAFRANLSNKDHQDQRPGGW